METLQKTVRLHRTQKAFRQSPSLYRGFVGGRGSGKSWVGAYDLIRRAKRDRLYMVASPTYTILADTTFRTFKKIANELGFGLCQVVESTRSQPPAIRLTTGAEIIFRSADDPERLRGANLSGIWLDEASLMHRDAYDIAIACLREGGDQGWLSATFTPAGLTHWTYDVFGQTPPKPDTAIFRSHTRDNPFNPPGFADTLERQYGPQRARQELGGEFVSLEGAEWPAEFFTGIFFRDWPPDLTLRVLALDPSRGKADRSGDFSAFALVGLDREWNLWADADLDAARPVESPKGGRSIVEDGLALFRSWQPAAFSVETNGFQHLVADALLRVAASRNIHLPLYGVCSTSPKASRIRALGTYLAQGRLRVRDTPGGRALVRQLMDFPQGEHDDGPDALCQGVRMVDFLLGRQSGPDAPELMRG